MLEVVSKVAAEEVDRRVSLVRSVPRHDAIQSDLRVVVEGSEVGLTLVNQKLKFDGACPFRILVWPAHRALYNIFAHLLWRLFNVDRLSVLRQGEVALYVLVGREAGASDQDHLVLAVSRATVRERRMDIVEIEDHSIFFLGVVNSIKRDLNERFIATDKVGWSDTLHSLGVLDYGRRGLHHVRPCAVVAAADQGPAALSHVWVSDRAESFAVKGDCGAAIHTAAKRGHTRDDGLYIVGEFKVSRDPINTVQRDADRVQSVDVFVWRGDARNAHR